MKCQDMVVLVVCGRRSLQCEQAGGAGRRKAGSTVPQLRTTCMQR